MEAVRQRGSTRLLIYPLARIGGRWRYLLFRNALSRRGSWHGMFTGPGLGRPADRTADRDGAIDLLVAREVRRLTGLQVTAVHSIDYAYRYSVLEHGESGFAPVHHDVTERVLVAFVRTGQPAGGGRDDLEWRWFTLEDALEAVEWLEHAEGLQRCEALADTLAAPLTWALAGSGRPPVSGAGVD